MQHSCGDAVESLNKRLRDDFFFRTLLDDLSLSECKDPVKDRHNFFDVLGNEYESHSFLGFS